MTYKDVLEQELHLILSKKRKYTMYDVHKVYVEMFLRGREIWEQRAKFIVICTAIYHDAEYSKPVGRQSDGIRT